MPTQNSHRACVRGYGQSSKLTTAQRRRVRQLIEDEGCTRAEAVAWVLAFEPDSTQAAAVAATAMVRAQRGEQAWRETGNGLLFEGWYAETADGARVGPCDTEALAIAAARGDA